jgi:predicted transposase YdaD
MLGRINVLTSFFIVKRNDILWKSILEDIFDDFLRFFCPEADQLFDFSRKFEYLDKELDQLFQPQDGRYSPKFVDKLVKVFTLAGDEEWVLVHIEVQGYRDRSFEDRMFTYYYRIWDKYRKRITAFVILTDDNPAFRPTCFEQSFLGTTLRYQFNSFKILDQSEDILEANPNPFAQVILTVKAALKRKVLKEEDLLNLKLQLARRLLSRDIPHYKIGKLLYFLKLYVEFNDERSNTKFDSEILTLTHNRYKTMGIEETLTAMLKEQMTERLLRNRDITFARNLLKSTDFDDEKIASLLGATTDFVNDVKNKKVDIIDPSSPEFRKIRFSDDDDDDDY